MGDLLGGRGERKGPDAAVDSEEAYDVRRRLTPDTNTWVVTNDDIYDDAVLDVNFVTANELHLSWIRGRQFETLGKDAVLQEARLSVSKAGASGAKIYSAIYLYDTNTKSAVIVPGTQATFDGTNVSRQAVTLAKKPALFSAGRYLLGVSVNDTTIGCRGMAYATASRLIPGYRASTSLFETPMKLQRMTKDYNMETISVAYLSPEAAMVL